ncbi:MAG: DUF368 domain-containing protein [Thermoplasmatota archaeon]
MRLKDFFKRFVEGLLMGAANIIPGVSGGTIALIIGIYDKLIHAINKIPKDLPIPLLKGDVDGFKSKLNDIDFPFLVPIAVGALISIISIARGLEFVMDSYPAITFAFFFGLILASVAVIYKYIEKINIRSIISAIIGFVFVFYVLGIEGIEFGHGPIMIFFSGVVSIVSMILPGISGSYILVILNQFEFMVDALCGLKFSIIIIFSLGALIGIFGFAKLLDYLLQKYPSVSMAFLFGLMLGALRVPLVKSMNNATNIYEIIIPAILGAVFVAILEYKYVIKDKIG